MLFLLALLLTSSSLSAMNITSELIHRSASTKRITFEEPLISSKNSLESDTLPPKQPSPRAYYATPNALHTRERCDELGECAGAFCAILSLAWLLPYK